MAASSTPVVLAILAEEDSYAILQRVRELSEGRMEWTDGMLYPVLHRLERLGHVEARWEVAESGRRRSGLRDHPPGPGAARRGARAMAGGGRDPPDHVAGARPPRLGGPPAHACQCRRERDHSAPEHEAPSRSRSTSGGATCVADRRSSPSTSRSWRITCASRSPCWSMLAQQPTRPSSSR